jgi:hypothetical protein
LKEKETVAIKEDAVLQPFKSDNAKLIKEVNSLHQELIRRKDIADAHQKASQV